MSRGKLYRSDDGQFVADVNYQFHDKSPKNPWGELTFAEYRLVLDGPGYVIELEDSSKCHCHLTRRINRAVSGVPPRYVYQFTALF